MSAHRPIDAETARAMLSHLDADMPRADWISIGMAVKSALGDGGYEIWDAWSATGGSYQGERDTQKQWRSMSADGGVGPGTLVHAAQAAGWRPGSDPRPAPVPARRQTPDDAAEQARAARWAAEIWAAAEQTAADHAYVKRKRIGVAAAALRVIDAGAAAQILGYEPRSGGEPLTGPLLVVPVQRDTDICTLELISGDGRKAALRGRGTRASAYWLPCPLPAGGGYDGPLLIGEGVATVASAAESTGEPAVAALSAGNLIAIAQSMRSRYPRADIVVLADLDKAGAAHKSARRAAAAVGGRLAVPAGGPGDDINDLYVGGGADAVEQCIADAQHVESDPGPDPDRSSTNPILARQRISPLAAMRSPRPVLDFVLPGLLRGTTGLIVAPGATGKTWLSLQLAAAVGGGLPICGGAWDQPERAGRVLVLGWEDPEQIIEDRLHVLMHYLSDGGISDESLDLIDRNVDIVSMHGDTSLLLQRDGAPGPLVQHLVDAAAGREYRLVTLDPLSRILGADENDNGLATRGVSMLEHVAHASGAAVVALHHAAKYAAANGQSSEQTAARGASALVDGVRWMSTLSTMTAAEAAEHDVEEVMRRFWVRLAVPKANYTSPLADTWLRREDGGVLTRGALGATAQRLPAAKRAAGGSDTAGASYHDYI